MYLFQLEFCLDICSGVGLLGHMVILLLVFWGTSILFFIVMHQLTFPPVVYERSLLSTSSPTCVICRVFNDGCSDWCEVIPHCSFDLILLFSFDFSSLLSFIHFKEAFQKFHISLLFNFHCAELIHMVEWMYYKGNREMPFFSFMVSTQLKLECLYKLPAIK